MKTMDSTSGDTALQSLQARLRISAARVVADDALALRLEREWDGPICRARLTNDGPDSIRVREIVLFDVSHEMPHDTPIYGESFQMLAQHAGTLSAPRDVGSHSDRKHYHLDEPDGLRTAYGLLLLGAPTENMLMGFSSCHKFIGRFGFDGERLRVSLDAENLELAPGQTWELEEFWMASGP